VLVIGHLLGEPAFLSHARMCDELLVTVAGGRRNCESAHFGPGAAGGWELAAMLPPACSTSEITHYINVSPVTETAQKSTRRYCSPPRWDVRCATGTNNRQQTTETLPATHSPAHGATAAHPGGMCGVPLGLTTVNRQQRHYQQRTRPHTALLQPTQVGCAVCQD
jgi:hypothetical protein